MKFTLYINGIAVALALFGGLPTEATPISVPNASFENPTTPTGGDGAPIPGWVFNSQSGNLYGTSLISNSFTSEGAASGNNYAFMFNDVAGKTDTITSAASLGIIEANTDYTLTVAVGNVAGSDSVSNHYPGNVSFSLLANGIAFATDTVPNGTVPDGTFEDFSLTFQTPSSGSIIGENLEIQLASLPTSGPGSGPAFDNVTLDATSIGIAPEPSTCALLFGGLLTLGWLIRRQTRSARIMASVSSLALAMTFAHATPIAIPNASFESPSTATGTGTTTGLIPGWTADLGEGDAYGTESIASYFSSPPPATSGNNFAVISNYDLDTPATLTSAASLGTIAASTQYTLTVAIGNVPAPDTIPYGAPGPLSFSLLGNGTPLTTQVVPNGTVANGTFEDFTLTYDSPSSGAVIGEDLTIQLVAMPQSTALYLAAFDNVTLDASPLDVITAPEPATAPLLIAGGLMLYWLFRQKHFAPLRRSRIPLLLIAGCQLGLFPVHGQAIKTFPLDEHLVYHLKVSPDKPTTIMFPGPITDLEGSGVTTDPKVPAQVLLSYNPGERYFSLRALVTAGTACLNVIANHKTYVLEMATDPVPFQSVTFYDSSAADGSAPGHRGVSPDRLLALLDEAKAYPLLKDQYPEVVAQIDHAEPLAPTLYPDFTVILTSVYRFDPEDALIFQLELQNDSDHPIYYVPQSLAVRVGSQVYWSALADASGVMPPGRRNPATGKIEPSHSFAYFLICGTPQGGRNHLAVTNHFNVLVFRQEKS